MNRIAAVAAALACAAAIASPAFAEGNGRTVNVQYSASDLLTPEGSARIQASIRAAARQTCAEPGLRGMQRRSVETACRHQTEADAMNALSIRMAEARSASRTSLAGLN